jgi:hypothetical protein
MRFSSVGEKMNNRKTAFTNMQIKKADKAPLDIAAHELSIEFGERIPSTRIFRTLVNHYIEDAKQKIRDEMNFVGK